MRTPKKPFQKTERWANEFFRAVEIAYEGCAAWKASHPLMGVTFR